MGLYLGESFFNLELQDDNKIICWESLNPLFFKKKFFIRT